VSFPPTFSGVVGFASFEVNNEAGFVVNDCLEGDVHSPAASVLGHGRRQWSSIMVS
jgi:hypothetical protein